MNFDGLPQLLFDFSVLKDGKQNHTVNCSSRVSSSHDESQNLVQNLLIFELLAILIGVVQHQLHNILGLLTLFHSHEVELLPESIDFLGDEASE